MSLKSRRTGPVTKTEDDDTPAMIGKLSRIVTVCRRKAGVDAPLSQSKDRRIGVLLAQLGTPDAPTPRRFVEIGRAGLEQFRAAGGETLQLVGGLNDRPRWIAAMTEIALGQLQGWT